MELPQDAGIAVRRGSVLQANAGKVLYDYTTQANLYQSCAALSAQAAGAPGIGYAEWAGFAPAGAGAAPGAAGKLLLVREARSEGRLLRRYEVLALDGFSLEKSAGAPQLLAAFNGWADKAWRRGSVALVVPRRDALPEVVPLLCSHDLGVSWLISVGQR